jgi:hypothetical protein
VTGRQPKRGFASRPGNSESWIRTPDRSADRVSGAEFTAGGEILLRLSGWPKVERVLAIDTVEAAGVDPVEACPDYWLYVHNRLTVGAEPRPYLRERHAAWLKRRRTEP